MAKGGDHQVQCPMSAPLLQPHYLGGQGCKELQREATSHVLRKDRP